MVGGGLNPSGLATIPDKCRQWQLSSPLVVELKLPAWVVGHLQVGGLVTERTWASGELGL